MGHESKTMGRCRSQHCPSPQFMDTSEPECCGHTTRHGYVTKDQGVQLIDKLSRRSRNLLDLGSARGATVVYAEALITKK